MKKSQRQVLQATANRGGSSGGTGIGRKTSMNDDLPHDVVAMFTFIETSKDFTVANALADYAHVKIDS